MCGVDFTSDEFLQEAFQTLVEYKSVWNASSWKSSCWDDRLACCRNVYAQMRRRSLGCATQILACYLRISAGLASCMSRLRRTWRSRSLRRNCNARPRVGFVIRRLTRSTGCAV